MAGETDSRTTTIIFTDLVNSTELMQRAGDEDAQRIFHAHYQLLRDAVSANGGAEVKTLGDGLMVAFNSAAEAVRCAIVMQQSSRRGASGARLDIRVGINTGDALRDEGDLFGTAVVVARRLCDRAAPGQILCSALVEGLLAGRQAFAFADAGALALKGIATPVAAREVIYEQEQPGALLTRTPFVGRGGEMQRLQQKLDEAKAGRGGLVLLVGEPGIGKSRTIEEFCERAASEGSTVLMGRCFEGEWAPPYGPFTEAIAGYAKEADPETLRADLSYGAPPIARLAPAVADRLQDIEEPAPLQPDEERFRLFDAVSQFTIALSQRTPVILVLDDLHWADRGTIAMLRHVARFASKQRMLILGAYRDIELDRQHPLSDALAQLRREPGYERVALKGLARDDVATMLEAIAEQEVDAGLVQAISDETDGNPFFIREVLIHLVEEGRLYREDGTWRSKASSIADLGIPEGVRQVITQRLSRLSEPANRLLTAASGFNGEFRFQTVGAVAGLDEPATLDAIDEALAAQILRPAERADHYDFTHALIRHTLYGEMNPSRQVRLHRQIAEALEARVATYTPERQASHAGELAYQYHRSAAIPGAERGVEFALAAADVAEANAAWDEVADFLMMALQLLPDGDARRGAVLGRLAIAQAWTLMPEDAERNAIEAARLIAERENGDAAADYLAELQHALSLTGAAIGHWRMSSLGLRYISPKRRDLTWARLAASDLVRREAEDPDNPGLPMPSPIRDAINAILYAVDYSDSRNIWITAGPGAVPRFETRTDALEFVRSELEIVSLRPGFDLSVAAMVDAFWVGDLSGGVDMWDDLARNHERQGAVALSVMDWSTLARHQYALGDIPAGDAALQRSRAAAARLPTGPNWFVVNQLGAEDDRRAVTGDWSGAQEAVTSIAGQQVIENRWAGAAIFAGLARAFAMLDQPDGAMGMLAQVIPPLERAPGDAANFPRIACNAAEALWVTGRRDHIEIVERVLREKVIAPDFRYVNVDARLELARLCALQGKYHEASEWFAKARAVLDEQGARPLRAICDYDEALMYARRGTDVDRERALPLLDAALAQFREIGMTGWARRAEELRERFGQPAS